MSAYITVTNSYSIQPTDENINVIPATGLTLLLPQISSVPAGKTYIIKDVGGTAASTNVAVGCQPGTTIDGAASASIVQNYGVMTVASSGSVWYINNDPVNVGGPAAVTSTALPRFNGTTGKSLSTSNILVTNLDAMSGQKYAFTANSNITTGYTLTTSDSGKLIQMNLSVSRALTLPNDLTVGFHCDVVQTGLAAGKVIFTPASGSTLTGNSAVTTSAGVWARCSLYVSANSSGTSAVYVLSGNVG